MKRRNISSGFLAVLLMLGMMLTAAADNGHVVTREPSKEEEETQEDREVTKQEVLNELPIDEVERGIREIRQDFHLALPSSLDFVIDPYEKEGRGQVFSEPFVIKNAGLGTIKVTISDLHGEKGSGQAPKKKIKKDLTIGYSADMTIGESKEEPKVIYKTREKEQPDQEEREETTIGYSAREEGQKASSEEELTEELTIGESDELTIGASGLLKTPQTVSGNIEFSAQPIDPNVITSAKRIQLALHRLDKQEPDIPILPEPGETIELILGSSEAAEYEITGTINPFPENDWKAGDVEVKATFGVEVLEPEEAERLLVQQSRKKQIEQEEKKEKAQAVSPKLHTSEEPEETE